MGDDGHVLAVDPARAPRLLGREAGRQPGRRPPELVSRPGVRGGPGVGLPVQTVREPPVHEEGEPGTVFPAGLQLQVGLGGPRPVR